MTSADKDRKIVEWFGFCYHSPKEDATDEKDLRCTKCGRVFHVFETVNIDFTSPEGFAWLWGKMREDKELWKRFIIYLEIYAVSWIYTDFVPCNMIDSFPLFRDTVGEFLPTLGESYEEWRKK